MLASRLCALNFKNSNSLTFSKFFKLRQLSSLNFKNYQSSPTSFRTSSTDQYTDTSNNEIEAFVANKEYGIEPRHLATIRAKQIRSPYKNRNKILVWREQEIKNYALKMYTSEESMNRAIRRKTKIRIAQMEFLKDKQENSKDENMKNVIFHSEADILLDEVIFQYAQLRKIRENKRKERGYYKTERKEVHTTVKDSDVPEAVVFDTSTPQVGTHQVSVLDNLSEFSRTVQAERKLKGMDPSMKVTITATVCNAILAIWKFMVFWQTGSYTMLSETYHSLADTMMQAGMAYSNYFAQKKSASSEHPYGYKQAPQIAALGAGICIFTTGALNSVKDGGTVVYECLNQNKTEILQETGSDMFALSVFNPFVVLGVSFFIEGYSLYTAAKVIQTKSKENSVTFRTQLNSQDDPTTTVVFYEDVAAVAGIAVAATAMGGLAYTGNPVFDGIGSIMVGGVLARIAYTLTMKGTSELLGRSIPETERQAIKDNLENESVVRGVYDLKVTYVGPQRQRMKAEVDFDGRAVGRNYLKGKNMEVVREEMRVASGSDELAKEFLLGHSEGSIDSLGNDIDRIERGLKVKHKNLRHIDLELN